MTGMGEQLGQIEGSPVEGEESVGSDHYEGQFTLSEGEKACQDPLCGCTQAKCTRSEGFLFRGFFSPFGPDLA